MANKNTTDELRETYTHELAEFLAAKFNTDVCRIAAGTLMIPVVDSEGEDRWVKFSIIIPKDASEENGNDGYSLAAEYKLKLEAKAARAAERETKSKVRKKAE